METHVKVLGVLYLAFSALALIAALVLFVVMGGAATITGIAAEGEDAALAVPIIGAVGFGLTMFLLVLSLPGLFTGWGLLQYRPWGRILGLVMSALNLINIPFGTLLGVYGLWVLLNKDTERLFSPTAAIRTST